MTRLKLTMSRTMSGISIWHRWIDVRTGWLCPLHRSEPCTSVMLYINAFSSTYSSCAGAEVETSDERNYFLVSLLYNYSSSSPEVFLLARHLAVSMNGKRFRARIIVSLQLSEEALRKQGRQPTSQPASPQTASP